MTEINDLLLLGALVLALAIVTTGQLPACVRAVGFQGAVLAVLPLTLWGAPAGARTVHLVLMSLGTFAIKAVLVPALLLRTIRKTEVRREVEPYVSLHASALIAGVLVALSFWLSHLLPLPSPAPTPLLAPVAFASIFLGFFVVVSRKKAITQVVGYLMLENGIFIFGQSLAPEIPFVVELGLLLDLLVGVFVFGITIHHIRRAFDDISVDALASLKD